MDVSGRQGSNLELILRQALGQSYIFAHQFDRAP